MNRQRFLNSNLHFKRNSTFSRHGLGYFDCADDRLKPIFRELEIIRADGDIRHAELTTLIRLDAAYVSRPVANLNDNFRQRLPPGFLMTPRIDRTFMGVRISSRMCSVGERANPL